MCDSVDLPPENHRLALLLARALRQADAETFLTVYDDIIPTDLPVTQVESIKDTARELADLPEEEFREKEHFYISMNSINDPVDSGLCSVSSTSSVHSQDYLTEESDISRKGLKHSDSLSKDDNNSPWEDRQGSAPFGFPPSIPHVTESAVGLIDDGCPSASITCPPAEPITETNLIQQVEQQLSTEKTVQQNEEDEVNRGYRCEVQSSEDMPHSGDGEGTGESGTGKKRRKRKKKKKKGKGEVSSGLVSPAESASSDPATNPADTQEHIPGSPNRISYVKYEPKYVTDVKVQGKVMIPRKMEQTEAVQESTSVTADKGKSAQDIEFVKQSYRTTKKDTNKTGENSQVKNTRETENDTAKQEAEKTVSKIRHSNNVMLKDKDSNDMTMIDTKKDSIGEDFDENESLHKMTKTGKDSMTGNTEKAEENRVNSESRVFGGYPVTAAYSDNVDDEQNTEDNFEFVKTKKSKKRQNKTQMEQQVVDMKMERQKNKGVNLRYRAKGPLTEPKNKQALKESVMSALYQSHQVDSQISPDLDSTTSQNYARRSRPNSAKASSDRRYHESNNPPSVNIHISRSAPHLPLKHLEDKIGQINGVILPTYVKQNLNDATYGSNEVLHFDCKNKDKQVLTRSDSLPEIPVSKVDLPSSASQSPIFSVDNTYASRLKKNLMTGPGNASQPAPENTIVAATCVKGAVPETTIVAATCVKGATPENTIVAAPCVKGAERKPLTSGKTVDNMQTSSNPIAILIDQTPNHQFLPLPVNNAKALEDVESIQFLSAIKTEDLTCDKGDDSEQHAAEFSYQKIQDKVYAVNSGKVKNKGILFPLRDPEAFGEDEDLGISFGTVVFKSGHLVLDTGDILENLKHRDGAELLREKHECAMCEDCSMFNHKEIARFLKSTWKNFTTDENDEIGKIVYLSVDG